MLDLIFYFLIFSTGITQRPNSRSYKILRRTMQGQQTELLTPLRDCADLVAESYILAHCHSAMLHGTSFQVPSPRHLSLKNAPLYLLTKFYYSPTRKKKYHI